MTPRIGVAYSAYVPRLIDDHPGLFDYAEVSFEMVQHIGALPDCSRAPLLLHSASLNLAGTVDASDATLDGLVAFAEAARAPWVSEHIAYLSAADPDGEQVVDLGFTLAPALNDETLERILRNAARFRARTALPLLLENPPLYLDMPDSTMSVPEFLQALCRASDADLLLDLSHFCIACINTGRDPHAELAGVPLERVRQVHVSGYVIDESGDAWDDHLTVASGVELELLETVARHAPLEAITLEYNWSPKFPPATVVSEAARVRAALAHGRVAV